MTKNIYLTALIFICLLTSSYGQSSCPKIFIESKYMKQYYPEGQDLAVQFSLIGLPLKSLIEEDRYPAGDNSQFYVDHSLPYQSMNAYPYIYKILEKNDIVLLNERHNRPEHRVFLYNILDSLKSHGINSIFLETLIYIENDSAEQSNHSIQSLGYYTRENVYNQVCHKLKRLKYNVYSYEINSANKIDTQRIGKKNYFIDKKDKKWIPIEVDTLVLSKLYSKHEFFEREAIQALHIYQKILRNNIKKAFIYCGYAHCYKSDNYMAGLLQRLIAKQVYSIDQIHLNEHSEKKFENPLYTKFAQTSFPFVITNNSKIMHSLRHPIYGYITDSLINVSVGSPRAKYINNRPAYLELNGDRKRYPMSKFIDVKKFSSDILIEIYEESEYEKNKINAIPEDVFQVEYESGNYDAILTPNRNYHLFVTKDNQILIDKIITTYE